MEHREITVDEMNALLRAGQEQHDTIVAALKAIARGRRDNGRPIGGERAREIAREVLTEYGLGWEDV